MLAPAKTLPQILFAELEKSPEHIHTYRITPLSLWNAAAAGLSAEHMAATLVEFAKYPVPQNVPVDVRDLAGRWGRVRLVRQDRGLVLTSDDTAFSQIVRPAQLGSDHLR